MPATAGRVRMPANNRVHSSAALQTHSIWENTIKHNPYAPKKDHIDNSDSDSKTTGNPYTNFQDLIKLAQITASNPDDESRGACKRCGRLGHLTFQCRNFLTTKSVKEKEEKDPIMQQKPLLSGTKKIKEESESEESETSDLEVDSEIKRIVAQRNGSVNGNGKKKSSPQRSSSRKKDVSDDSDSDSRVRKRGKSKKRRSQKKRGRSDPESEDEVKRKRRKKRKRSNKEKEEVVKP